MMEICHSSKTTLAADYRQRINRVIDIKPYHPAVDRVKNVSTPSWCSHWPQWYEESGDFNWTDEFNFPL